ncbi:MAG: type IV secretion system protein [Burkholderiales bacterium]|jgi:type IV secretion system protein VirB5|nr:type IV secretion system protein [Burkholderiales bacterium]
MEKANCQTALKNPAQTLSNMKKSFEKMQGRIKNVQDLKTRIDSTDDIKAAADLTARMEAETSAISNAMGELMVMLGIAEQQELIRQEQEAQLYKRYFSTKNVPELKPITWR